MKDSYPTPERDRSAYLLLPQAVQAIIDKTSFEYLAARGISEVELKASPQPESVAAISDSTVSNFTPGRVDVSMPRPVLTTHLLAGSSVAARSIDTAYGITNAVPDGTSLYDWISFPFKTVAIDASGGEKANQGRWLVQIRPDSPPVMLHEDDVRFVREQQGQLTASDDAIARTQMDVQQVFGPEAVRMLDEDSSRELIAVLGVNEGNWRVDDGSGPISQHLSY